MPLKDFAKLFGRVWQNALLSAIDDYVRRMVALFEFQEGRFCRAVHRDGSLAACGLGGALSLQFVATEAVSVLVSPLG